VTRTAGDEPPEEVPSPAPPTVRDPGVGFGSGTGFGSDAGLGSGAGPGPGVGVGPIPAPPTVRDSPGPGPAASRVNLPLALTDRYVLERELGGGGEADVMLARDRADATPVVVRRYRRDAVEVDIELMTRLRDAHGGHLIGLLDWGRDATATWEILEYAPFGSVHDLYRTDPIPWPLDRVRAVVEQLHAALAELHAMDVVHRDVKPQNILVRSVEPLDLALTDFGLARVLAATREMRTASRTSAYAAPEAALGATSRDLDWWSLGIVVVELITGRNPFQRPDGGWFHDMQILNELTSRDIPLDAVTDERWRRLCRGLLTRDPRRRWRGEQVRAWLDGQDPPADGDWPATDGADGTAFGGAEPPAFGGGRARARPGTARAARAGTGTGRAYVFADVPYRDPRALAAALAADWTEAERILGGPPGNPRLLGLRDWLHDVDEDDAARIVERDGLPARRLLQLVLALDPTTPPVLRGQPLSQAALGELLASVAAAGTGPSGATVTIETLYNTGALSIVDGLPGCAGLAVVDDRWHRLVAALDAAVPPPARPEVPIELWRLAGARMLAIALAPAAAADLRAEAAELGRDARARGRPWFRELVRSAGGADGDRATATAMAVVLSAEVAAAQTSRETADAAHGSSLRAQRQRAARRARIDAMSPMFSLVCGLLAFIPTVGYAFVVGAFYFWYRVLRAGEASRLRNAGAILALFALVVQLYLHL
jgi:hypothetical protein